MTHTTIEEEAQKIVDMFFREGARVSKFHYDEVLKALTLAQTAERERRNEELWELIRRARYEGRSEIAAVVLSLETPTTTNDAKENI